MGVTEELAATHLGKKSVGSELYDKSLLVAVPRSENREQYHIEEDDLPFVGYDVWDAYEFSCMTTHGVPFTRVLKLKYPVNNPYIVESKSLKLYLNSFNMSRFGDTIREGLNICKNIIERDLSELLKTNVEAAFLDSQSSRCEIFKDYENILDYVDEQNISITRFDEAPDELVIDGVESEACAHKLSFDSIRSNCLITKQPDFSRIFIYYKSKKHLTEEGILKYMVSFRKENHFHEQVVEMMYSRFFPLLDAEDELLICALYTRRGGIDINPVRYTLNCAPAVLEDVKKLADLTLYARGNICQ